MTNTAIPEPDSEEEYLSYLEGERHMYAWCLTRYGKFSAEEAKEEALKQYPYEPPSDAHRWLVFHDLSWHWAMIRIHGNGYWWSRPELEPPSEEYEAEIK